MKTVDHHFISFKRKEVIFLLRIIFIPNRRHMLGILCNCLNFEPCCFSMLCVSVKPTVTVVPALLIIYIYMLFYCTTFSLPVKVVTSQLYRLSCIRRQNCFGFDVRTKFLWSSSMGEHIFVTNICDVATITDGICITYQYILFYYALLIV